MKDETIIFDDGLDDEPETIESLLALLAEKDEEIEELRNSKQNLGVALGKMTVKFANSFDRAEEAEIKESTAALEIILLKSKLKAAEQKVKELQTRLDGRTYFHSDELVEAENKRLIILVREANQNVVESNYLLRECEEKFLDYTRGGCIKMRSDLIKRIQQFLKEEKT